MTDKPEGGYLAIGPIDDFAEGWAKFPFVGERAHYWKEDASDGRTEVCFGGRIRYYTSLCSLIGITTHKVPALNPGNFPRCMKCARVAKFRRAG